MFESTVSGRGYELKEEIGSGGFGVVYRAYQTAVGRDVAVKVILPEIARDPMFARRFEKEARLSAGLEHPNIVPLYDYWRDEERAYLVMRWLRGGNLKEALAQGPWELLAVKRLVEQIAGALSAAHDQGVVHRDLKPSNILLDETGNAYLADFGIAKHLVGTTLGTPTGAIMGSPAYMAPEQIQGGAVTAQSDLYSLGGVLYEVLTGEPPFGDAEPVTLIYKGIHEPLPLVCDRRPELPAAIDQVIQRATAKIPVERYPDAQALAEAFSRAISPMVQISATEILPQAPEMPSFLVETAVGERQSPLFVGRDRELAWLDEQLDLALGGEGRVLFIAGEAGSGKSSIMSAITRQAGTAHPDL
jgi:serine/threonine protein kinase